MKRNIQSNILLLSIIAAFISVMAMLLSPGKYFFAIFFPVTYTIVLSFFVVVVNKRKTSFTSFIFFVMAFLRYVIVPTLGCFTDYYDVDKKFITDESLDIALILMIVELICAGLFLTVLECSKKRHRQEEKFRLTLYGSKLGYIVFVAVAFLVYITIGRDLDLKINFFMLSADVDRTSDSVETLVSFVNLLISAALFFVTVVIINRFKNKYDISKSQSSRSWYVLCSLLFVLIPICTIFGERRVSVLNVAIGYMVLLIAMYPEYSGKIIKRLSLGAGSVIVLMSLYKTLAVFLYSSYEEAVNSSNLGLTDFVCQLDSYFLGMKTVARNVTFSSVNSVGLSNALYDIFRNIFGLSFFLKGDLTTSEIFNLNMTNGRALTGTLFSGCGYAYCYTGFILCFADICIKLGILMKIEQKIRTARYYEWKYVWGYIYSILAYFMFGSIVLQINSVTRFLFCYAIFIYCSSIFRRLGNNRKMNYHAMKEQRIGY